MNADIEHKLLDMMLNCFPEKDLQIISGCYTFTSVKQTHESYKQQLINAPNGSRVREMYLDRCYSWLVMLKQHNVKLILQTK